MMHIWSPRKLSNFQEPWTPYPSKSKLIPPPWRPISNDPHPFLQMITNQLKENIIQRWLLYVTKSFLQVSFHFQYQLINLAWLFFDFFSSCWSLTICFFVALYFCVQLPKNVTKYLLYMIIHIFSAHFAINLFHLHNLKM